MPPKKQPLHLNLKKGAFTKQAKAAGMTVKEFAKHVEADKKDYSDTTQKRANFAEVAAKWKHKGKKTRAKK
jgi:hypothetical protein